MHIRPAAKVESPMQPAPGIEGPRATLPGELLDLTAGKTIFPVAGCLPWRAEQSCARPFCRSGFLLVGKLLWWALL